MAKPLKILQVSQSMLTGGLERIIVEMVLRGPEYGFVSSVAALKQAGELAESIRLAGASFDFLGKRDGLDFRMVGRLAKLVKSRRIELIQAHNVGAGLYAGLAGILTRRPVVNIRHGLSFGVESPWLCRAAGWLCTRTVCVGRAVEDAARTNDFLPASRLQVIYNGVDPAEFRPDPAAGARVRRELGIPRDALLALAVGRLAPVKDYPGLLKAAALVPGLSLMIAGHGPSHGELARMVEELGLENRVRLLGTRDDVPRLLQAADVFVLSSLSEGISKAILEAMSTGLAVVATNVGGNPELVLQDRTGILVPARDPAALALALDFLARNPDAARKMGALGRETVLAKFQVASTFRAYAGLYRSLVKRRP